MPEKRLKVLHVISDTNFGGAGRCLLTLLGRREYTEAVEASVACPGYGVLWEKLERTGVRLYPLPGGDKSFDPRQLPSLYSLVLRGQFDLVHTHASLTARLAARLVPGVRIVFTKHTLGGVGTRGRFSALAQRLLADRVICPSKAAMAEMESIGLDRYMLDLIYNGVEVEAIREAVAHERLRTSLTPGKTAPGPVIVSTGRLEPEKGHEYLIRAMPRVLKHYPSARLVIAGDGSLEPKLHDLARSLGIEQSVELAGFVNDIPALLARADLFVLPSLSEALGISLLEAMAAGVPSVASDTGGIPEIITPGVDGLLVPPGDSNKIAVAMLSLLGDRSLASLIGRRAFQTVSERFSAQSQALSTVESYVKAMRPGR